MAETVRKLSNPTHGSGWMVQVQPTGASAPNDVIIFFSSRGEEKSKNEAHALRGPKRSGLFAQSLPWVVFLNFSHLLPWVVFLDFPNFFPGWNSSFGDSHRVGGGTDTLQRVH